MFNSFTIIIIFIILLLCLFVYYLIKRFLNNKQINTSCIICGKSINSKQLTTCSSQCNTIAKSKAKTFVKRLRSNVNRQKHITGYELTYNQWLLTLKYFNNKCAYCNKPVNKSTVQLDHFIPVHNGGTFIYKNILPACQECNQSKSKKSPTTFIKSLPIKTANNIQNFIKH